MQDFNYSVSLHVSHPEIDPALISTTLSLEPTGRMTRAGEPKTTPNGTPREGCWEFSHWKHKFGTMHDQELVSFLRHLIRILEPSRTFLQRIVEEGGAIEFFVGVFTDTNCDQILPHDLLARLADLRIDLRLDPYGNKLRQKDHPERL
jgi:hypothetical protein